jgi:hypothetical protein
VRTPSWDSEGKRKVWIIPTGIDDRVSTRLHTATGSAIHQFYLKDISFREFECPCFELDPLPRLGLDRVDTFVIVIVVHREVGGQQSALGASDGVATLSCKESHNSHRLTHIRLTHISVASRKHLIALENFTGVTSLFACLLICLSVSRIDQYLAYQYLPTYSSA